MMNSNLFVKAISAELDKFGQETDNRVYLAVEHRDIPGLDRGDKFDISFRIKNRRYNSYLLSFYLNKNQAAVEIDWGEETTLHKTSANAAKKVAEILNLPAVQTSRRQLLTLYEDSDRSGTVKTLDFDTLGGMDFEILVSPDEFKKFENAYHQGESETEILARQAEHSILPGKYVDQVKSQYRFLELDGMRAHIKTILMSSGKLRLTITDVH